MAVLTMLLVAVAISTGLGISPCQEDEFFHPRKQTCMPCRVCLDTEYEVRKCEGISNRICSSCPNDTFLGDDRKCRNCTICVHGTILQCNSTMDSFCKERKGKSDSAPSQKTVIIIAVVVAVVIFFVFLIMVVCFVRRRRQRGKQIEEAAQQLDTELDHTNESPDESVNLT